MKNFIPKFLLVTMVLFIFTTVSEPISSYASDPDSLDFEEHFFDQESDLEDMTINEFEGLSDRELEELGVNTDEDFSEFNEEILNNDFDVEEAVDNLDLAKLEGEEKENLLKVIEETAAISGTEEVELLEEALLNFFDSDSDVFNDIEAAQEELEENYIAKLESEENPILAKSVQFIFGSEKAYAKKKKKGKIAVGMYLTGSVINVAIGGVVGGGIAAVKTYVKKKGKKAASATLSRVATAQAKKLKIKSVRGVAIATVIGGAISVALDYANVGLQIAKQIDKRDWYPGNEWIDITK
ncbi:hypothetical protein CAY60_015460 [Shouchella clausii]|uniref:hypothetical protein n=1 Tax=Shouchella TaxID=2893057 RepID=UPI0004E74E50|nr:MULTISPECIES: hypothetical protein [Shouchella]ALA52921.1 hypothetical protein DB29_02093 [Shouchella clausii]MBU3231515.1 hypothetical protein [Shouchella clausii]MBU3263481.1 hypothetical protein [Shouchella clausii]MBU3507872.1 hypothetical protein [Shouchella clausii]MBU3536095.1 hypothetical protein [Shouchella clausii]